MDNVQGNIKAREAAGEVMEFVCDVANERKGTHRLFEVRFWSELLKLVERKFYRGDKPKVWEGTTVRKMTGPEARRFGDELIPFGEFRGKRIDEVPLDRLAWYADQTFVDDLRKYLASDRVKVESR